MKRRIQKLIADVLVKTAYKIDPYRPTVTFDKASGGHQIRVGDVKLAHISPGMIQDTRGWHSL